MIADIEHRYPECGFLYTDRTRMLFCPKHFVTRSKLDKEKTDLALSSVSGRWPMPTKKDIEACLARLKLAYPGRGIYIDTDQGLVPAYFPS